MWSEPKILEFNSRRSPVLAMNGICASSQPLATQIGIKILQQGGNAADAAVAIAAALNVTQPSSTGIGGDCFCIFYDSKSKKVKGLNGSGRAPKQLTIDHILKQASQIEGHELKHWNELDWPASVRLGSNAVTVPGAAAGWIDTIETFGKLKLNEVLQPAIDLCDKGFPVNLISAHTWRNGFKQLMSGPNANELLMPDGQTPKLGDVFKNKNLGDTFRSLISHGKSGFYEGRIASEIVHLIQNLGGVMTLEDLKSHKSTFDDPVSVNYRGVDVWELPPNGQGITALMALNILEGFDVQSMKFQGTQYLHVLIDSRYYICDPNFESGDGNNVSKSITPLKELLSKQYANERRKHIFETHANTKITHGFPANFSNTVYLSVVDGEGNACSFINSNYQGFGTGLIPKGCGFTLQNRGANFSLDPTHPNSLQGGKRPYHTIIPGMATKDSELFCSFGVMGGWMQPQGHVQVISNMIDFGMDPQAALDQPRVQLFDGSHNGKVYWEEGISGDVVKSLKSMGHNICDLPSTSYDRIAFGMGQIIHRNPKSGVLWAGSDCRADGLAIGY